MAMHLNSLKLKSMTQQLEGAKYIWKNYSLKQMMLQKERLQLKAKEDQSFLVKKLSL
jgi:hypothetical protein